MSVKQKSRNAFGRGGSGVMTPETVFKRYEIKYIISRGQKEKILHAIRPYIFPDEHGRSTIRNVYYDTSDSRLARRSEEKPVYKEKLRVRSYKRVETDDDKVFVELKKKYDSVVYKRRAGLPEKVSETWLEVGNPPLNGNRICEEIEYFRKYYGPLIPAAFVSYDREAFCSSDGSGFRVTFDDNILARTADISLRKDVGGKNILGDGLVLMELKTHLSIPLWMTCVLTENRIFKTSFSKYGTVYRTMIFDKKEN